MTKDIYDITIIGSGPAGLFSAFYAGLREMKTKILEGNPELGGKVKVYPQKMVWDVGGVKPVTGQQLIDDSIEQALTFDPAVELNTIVTGISKDDDGIFNIHTESKTVHYSRTVIVAIGGSGIISHQKIDVPSAESYEGKGLHYTVFDVKDFDNKDVLVSGGGPTAVDWGNDLAPNARSLTLIYRGDKVRALEADITRMQNNGVRMITNTEIVDFNGHNEVSSVKLYNNKTGEHYEQEYDAVLINHGYNKDNLLFKENKIDIELVDNFYIPASSTGETKVEGVYAAGDCVKYPGKVHLIAGAYQDAVNAVNNAKLFIQPDAHKTAEVSSHNHILDEKNMKYMYSEETLKNQ
ncbi:NAD(P)/FAD-dependent oxidoreductase [Corticicoccus populi]|uniref:Ferredoxin--NADP reductase n=1 Tax=Corticicoccus populi TaxID=1812821 RepID=A0ABW5WWZ5_9STAP